MAGRCSGIAKDVQGPGAVALMGIVAKTGSECKARSGVQGLMACFKIPADTSTIS